ncbi:hypothetical protein [Sphingomonas sp. RIT328]|uniref:hypothetical protein n=1 Tax=Sphingomonas sp. RIT328 TaxID=1470591 RepID=UPI00044628ED|nr:hypothetical protein [Sphingomonas sp. RIT328]EZP50042.1 hypothetical protein BW41_03367 [Sphingomonas sp. RIT328]
MAAVSHVLAPLFATDMLLLVNVLRAVLLLVLAFHYDRRVQRQMPAVRGHRTKDSHRSTISDDVATDLPMN